MSSTIWYTERQASGVWPYPFIDVTAKTSQHGPSLDVIFTACAANQGGDLHVLASDVAGKLWHTILLANGNWPFPFGDLQVAANSNIGSILFTACAANQSGDLHVLALDVNRKLWHTIRQASGIWPAPFEDVQAKTSQHGPNIGPIDWVACATNSKGDLHVLATDANWKLWHTIRLANGGWSDAFRDVQAQLPVQHTSTGIGLSLGIGLISIVACATNSGDDLHVLALDRNQKLWHTIRQANSTWADPFGDVQAQTSRHLTNIIGGLSPNIGKIANVASATNPGGDLHVLALDVNWKLWHTIRLNNGAWPYAFGDVQAQTGQHGPDVNPIYEVACATNPSGDLHVCIANGVRI